VVGLSVSDHGVAISHGVLNAGEFTILKLDYAPVQGLEQRTYIKGWVARNKLKNADCHYVLNKDEYELELVETPLVADDELAEAVRWRLKDLISLPIEDAIIDIFPLPEDAYRGRMKMLYVVAADKSVIEDKLKFIRSCGLSPSIIDIEEMALRNIALYLPDMDQGTIALLNMRENSGEILMFSHEAMYLSRSIEMGFSSLVNELETNESENYQAMTERFVLDVQRSLDYYESQLGKGIASKVYILPADVDLMKLQAPLQEFLSPKVLNLDCSEFIPFGGDINLNKSEQVQLLPVIGAVLRRVA
jgi:MSHA biogenesis protein MshI